MYYSKGELFILIKETRNNTQTVTFTNQSLIRNLNNLQIFIIPFIR